ncbi:hypothetical protein EIN_244130, partial [Entamoeba invadens IP1]
MFALLFLVSFTSAFYQVSPNSLDGSINIIKLGRIYNSGTLTYAKIEYSGNFLNYYYSTDCKEWVPQGSSTYEHPIVYSIPDFIAAKYTYDATGCVMSNEDANPDEVIYTERCITSVVSSSQYVVENDKLYLKTYSGAGCTGTFTLGNEIATLDKCVDNSKSSYQYTSGAVEFFALFAVALAS